jgi:hypothetical protein
MAVILALLVALAAALLGVAAARRGWWPQALIAGACSFLATFAAIYLAGPAVEFDLPFWASAAASLIVVAVVCFLAATAHVCEQDGRR